MNMLVFSPRTFVSSVHYLGWSTSSQGTKHLQVCFPLVGVELPCVNTNFWHWESKLPFPFSDTETDLSCFIEIEAAWSEVFLGFFFSSGVEFRACAC
jgi:hypothetical protein